MATGRRLELGLGRLCALVALCALFAGSSFAHPPDRAWMDAFHEGFAAGFDHPELVTQQNDLSFEAGTVQFGAAGELVIEDPELNVFAGASRPHAAFADIEIRVRDDALTDWEIEFEGPVEAYNLHEYIATLRLVAAGETLTLEWVTPPFQQRQQSLARSGEWLVLRAGGIDDPSLTRAGGNEELHELYDVRFYPTRVTLRGSDFAVDEIVITPWVVIGTEEKSWGGVKGKYWHEGSE